MSVRNGEPVIQIPPITGTAEDAGLIAEIDQFNAEAAEHNSGKYRGDVLVHSMAALQFNHEELRELWANRCVQQLEERQRTGALCWQRYDLLKRLRPERERCVAESKQAETKAIQTTTKKLIAAGLGPDAQNAARFGNDLAAERQFQATVIQSKTVQSAIADRKNAERRLKQLNHDINAAAEMFHNAEKLLESLLTDYFSIELIYHEDEDNQHVVAAYHKV